LSELKIGGEALVIPTRPFQVLTFGFALQHVFEAE
jgi:hypothetical protein